MDWVFLLVAFCSVSVLSIGADCPRIVCYHTNWSQYRPGAGKFTPDNIDPTLCTHINYAFAKMIGNKLHAFEWNDDSTTWSTGMFEKFINAKTKNPNVKLLLSVGGWNMGSGAFHSMVQSAASRHEFAVTSVQFLRDRNFDGLDIDWEYPANRGSPPQDRDRYTELIKEIRRVFDADTSGTRLLLTAAVPAGKPNIDPGYNIPELMKHFDFVNLMTYDLHGSWETFTGHNSPLYAGSKDVGDERHLNMDWAANYWVSKGAPKNKLNLGVGTYGRSFTLRSSSSTGLHTATRSKGTAGKYTREGGFLSYYEICEMQRNGGQVHRIVDQGNVPYIVKGDQWVGYDDQESLRIKIQYIKHHNFGGVMIWAMDLDDFKGNCGHGVNPLMSAIKQECSLNSGLLYTRPPFVTGNPNPPITTPGVNPTYAPVTSDTPYLHHVDSFTCFNKADGFYPSPVSCVEYYICAAKTSFRVKCADGLTFNTKNKLCDWPQNHHCTVGQATQAPPVTYQTQRPLTNRPPTHTTKRPIWPAQSSTPPPVYQTTHTFHNTFPPSGSSICTKFGDGIHADPADCNHYVECSNGREYHFNCAPGTVYDDQIHTCDWPVNVPNCVF